MATESETPAQPGTFEKGKTWGGLRKAWKGYKIAKAQHDKVRRKEYAEKIRTLQQQLGVPVTNFPDLGLNEPITTS